LVHRASGELWTKKEKKKKAFGARREARSYQGGSALSKSPRQEKEEPSLATSPASSDGDGFGITFTGSSGSYALRSTAVEVRKEERVGKGGCGFFLWKRKKKNGRGSAGARIFAAIAKRKGKRRSPRH